jgi:hypothetical protein
MRSVLAVRLVQLVSRLGAIAPVCPSLFPPRACARARPRVWRASLLSFFTRSVAFEADKKSCDTSPSYQPIVAPRSLSLALRGEQGRCYSNTPERQRNKKKEDGCHSRHAALRRPRRRCTQRSTTPPSQRRANEGFINIALSIIHRNAASRDDAHRARGGRREGRGRRRARPPAGSSAPPGA